jgi:hypothetical protein
MAAGVTGRLFDVSELVALLVESEKKAAYDSIESGRTCQPGRIP